MKRRIKRAKLFYNYAHFWGFPLWVCLRVALNGFLGFGTLGD